MSIYLVYSKEGSLEVDSIDGFQYDEVTIDDEYSISGNMLLITTFLLQICNVFYFCFT